MTAPSQRSQPTRRIRDRHTRHRTNRPAGTDPDGPKIVFLIVAAAAPLGAMVATVPLAFSIGNGPASRRCSCFAGLTLLCFSVGYAAMGRRIVNAGGFYTYISCGLGKPVAVMDGFVAIVAYNAITIGVLGAFGYFAQSIAQSHGLNLP